MRRINRQRRICLFLLLITLSFSFLILKLFKIQIIDGGRYALQAVKQRSQAYVLDTGRGEILDRQGLSLTGSYMEKVLIVFPALVEDIDQLLKDLNLLTGKELEISRAREIIMRGGPAGPLKIAEGLEEEKARLINSLDLPGVIILPEKVRYGPDSLASHLVGYMGRRSREDLWGEEAKPYSPADYVGRAGMEEMFERELRGEIPERVSIVLDAFHSPLEGLGYRHVSFQDRVRPLNVKLTLDSRAQKWVEKIMDEYIVKGAVVVMEPRSGDILALSSRPQLDQRNLESGENDFLNRALQNYPPGSIFKVVVTVAALEEGKNIPVDLFLCTGSISIGEDAKQCFQGIAHGEITLQEALAYSCNTAFIEAGLSLGREKIIEYARKMGLGEITGLYPSHLKERERATGNIPAPEEMPYLGHLANTVLGQGRVLVTPLQVAQLFTIIANEGRMVKPRLVSELTNNQGQRVIRYPTRGGERVLLPSTARHLKNMLTGVTLFGTGQEASTSSWSTAGKTGTAQAGVTGEGEEKNIYWFAGFSPMKDPAAVAVVLIEEGKGESAAFVYKEIMKGVMEVLRGR
ncbi:MAG: penicillin-binding protein 2 [Candidatus Syntrophonatronum acetioxidans]|uniref:Penicillin-binding protein 2 n=1 Tax=Candidatus Syntrophonatronum acetioxidans TaxID=1795816 RepID=A0A424YHC4_9FIRM|nr:MAG: penicillin-binding protein 2 [Candidatus Syntrophonatronum acetioxidans]